MVSFAPKSLVEKDACFLILTNCGIHIINTKIIIYKKKNFLSFLFLLGQHWKNIFKETISSLLCSSEFHVLTSSLIFNPYYGMHHKNRKFFVLSLYQPIILICSVSNEQNAKSTQSLIMRPLPRERSESCLFTNEAQCVLRVDWSNHQEFSSLKLVFSTRCTPFI